MNRHVRIAGLVGGLLLVIAACSSEGDSTTTLPQFPDSDTGATNAEIAPEFSVATADGGTFSLDSHLLDDGRPLFLNLWASWCFPCRKEMPAIESASLEHTDVRFIGVSVQDTEEAARAFLDEIGVTYEIGFDTANEVDDGYRPLGLPASYIISADGVILERIFGEVTEESLAEKFEQHFG